MPTTHYEALNVSPQASTAEIHQCYRAAALACHPDRNAGRADATVRFQTVQHAWEVLGNADLRAAYDAALAAVSEGRISEEVDLDDMQFEKDGPAECYTWPCRCGSCYMVRRARNLRTAQCLICALLVRVLSALLPTSSFLIHIATTILEEGFFEEDCGAADVAPRHLFKTHTVLIVHSIFCEIKVSMG